jgi:transketolase C-terminal domain/subunit
VQAAAAQAVAKIRATGQPQFLELLTYRLRGHFEPDDQAYVDAEELAHWQARDPIETLRGRLADRASDRRRRIAAMEERVRARIADAVAFAQASAWPAAETLTDHVICLMPASAERSTARMIRMTAADAIHLALREEMQRDPRVLFMGEGVATKHPDLARDFGAARVRNTPLAEAIIAGTAVGAAASGLRPVIDLLFAPFLGYAMDALVNSAGKLRYLSGGQFEFPLVTLAMTGSGWCVGAQHNHNLEAMFVHAPGLHVVMPSQPADFKGLLKAAIRDANPTLFFADMALLYQEGEVPEDPEHLVPLGKAAVRRAGTDVTLVSYAKTVGVCLQAADNCTSAASPPR